SFCSVGRDEKLTDLGPVREKLSVTADSIGRVEAHLPPVGNAICQLRRAVECTVRHKPTWKVRRLAAVNRIIRVQLNRPLADFGDFGVVDLNLINRVTRGHGRCISKRRQQKYASSILHGVDEMPRLAKRGSKLFSLIETVWNYSRLCIVAASALGRSSTSSAAP